MPYQNILAAVEDGLGIITINRPDVRNALTPQTWEEIRAAVRAFKNDNSVKVLAFNGAGDKAFASGSDIRVLLKRKFTDVLANEVIDTLAEIESLPKPVLAVIDGFAVGGGCELAMACDFRIATDRSKLGQPEVLLGVIPAAGGTQRLQRLVGFAKAKELIMTGELIDAMEAERIGLVNRVVVPDKLMEAVREMADKLISSGPLALALAKAAINAGANVDLASGLLIEKLAQALAFCTEDKEEGVKAFLEKRKPDFRGC
jgi:enoyl-CoA hydratase